MAVCQWKWGAVLVMLGTSLPAQGPLRIADLGECHLTDGARLPDCRMSFRVYGTLNAAKTNAVLLPTWFNGSSQAWQGLLGPEGYVDTTRFAAIAVDAFGAGRSTSPADSAWRDRAFPTVGIADMVMAQRRVLREHLGIERLHAIVGISMGGMQAFEWGVRYPDEVGRVVSVEGSPRLTSYDRILWEAMLAPLAAARRQAIPRDSALAQVARLFALNATTPTAVNRQPADSVPAMIRARARSLGGLPLENMILQLQAMIGHDASRVVGGDASAAHRAFTARLLVVASPDDHAVTAHSALAFARAVQGDTLVLASTCGHQVFTCERAQIGAAVRAFLAR